MVKIEISEKEVCLPNSRHGNLGKSNFQILSQEIYDIYNEVQILKISRKFYSERTDRHYDLTIYID